MFKVALIRINLLYINMTRFASTASSFQSLHTCCMYAQDGKFSGQFDTRRSQS